MKTLIEATEVSHSFGEKKVLDHISFRVGRGNITGLLGPSGAGKTTLIQILTGQIRPSAGAVKVMGQEMGVREKKTCAAGIMMDCFGFYERLSVWDNLKIYADIYRVRGTKIEQLLERTGLAREKKTPVGKLSKGMRNRVNFCRALLRDVDILYLDEPASGLDPAAAEKIHELILEEKKAGTTIFLTTHNMHEAEELCDLIMLLNAGKIVEQGVPKEICMKYNTDNRIEVALKNGGTHVIQNTGEGADMLAEWMKAKLVLSVHSMEPDLEKVFLAITGRRLTGE